MVLAHLPEWGDMELLSAILSDLNTWKDDRQELHGPGKIVGWDLVRRLDKILERNPGCCRLLIDYITTNGTPDGSKIALECLLNHAGYTRAPWRSGAGKSKSDSSVKRNAWLKEWWEKNKDKSPLERLESSLLDDENRAAAVKRLSTLDDPKAIDLLIKYLDDGNQAVSRHALAGLVRRKCRRLHDADYYYMMCHGDDAVAAYMRKSIDAWIMERKDRSSE